MRFAVSALCLLLVCGPAFAARDNPFLGEPADPMLSGEFEDEDKDKGWKEAPTSLPPWPQDADLVEFGVDDPASRFRHYIDGKSLAVGPDGAVRYTLVAVSRSGVRNLSLKGLRCTPSGLFKVYAYGNAGRFEWAEGDWTPVRSRPHDKVHRALHEWIFCAPMQFEPRSKQEMFRAMKGGSPDHVGGGFVLD